MKIMAFPISSSSTKIQSSTYSAHRGKVIYIGKYQIKKTAFKTNNIEDKTNYKQNATEFSSTPPAVPSDRVSRDSSSTILPAFTLSNITLLFWGWHPIIYDKRLNYCYKRIVTGFILKIKKITENMRILLKKKR